MKPDGRAAVPEVAVARANEPLIVIVNVPLVRMVSVTVTGPNVCGVPEDGHVEMDVYPDPFQYCTVPHCLTMGAFGPVPASASTKSW